MEMHFHWWRARELKKNPKYIGYLAQQIWVIIGEIISQVSSIKMFSQKLSH